ncbi:MAG: hypothetical protein J6S61_05600, partial [Elusimicrobiaceae bacterium]|nr:hypothetical protein [Elusimicrobiaceae bacterium]
LAEKGNIEKSLEYIDKFNEILIEHYDKIFAAQILKEEVENGLISQAHQEELFEKLDEYLFKIGKCNPGICEGWGIISTVAGAFPKCAENSCQKNITYENLYFDLAKTTNNSAKATETIKKLLTKDFGTPRSNGEVKAPLMMALYYTDLDAFFAQAKHFLDKAQKTIKYDYQDAILLPLITQLMLENGGAKDLFPYTETKHKNIAGLEVTLALLSTHLGDSVRQNLRADLEIYYELTSACEVSRYEEYQGQKILRAGTPATLTQNTELDLFLRQRIQAAYWVDDYGGLMESKATDYWCSPTLNPEEIDAAFASAQIAKQFIKESLIDDVVLLPLFAFNKIKAVVKGVKQAPKLRISYIDGKAVEKARNARRVKKQLETNIQKLWEMPDELRVAAGQDFMPGYIGDRGVSEFTNGRTWHNGSPKEKALQRQKNLGNGRSPRYIEQDIDYESILLGEPKKVGMNKNIAKQKKHFDRKATASMREIGFEKANKLAEELGMEWQDLERFMDDKELSELLGHANPTRTEQIIKRIRELYYKYHSQITSNSGHKFTFAYIAKPDIYGVDITDIQLVEEIVEKNEYLKTVFIYGKNRKPEFLSNSWWFSPKTPNQTLDAYTALLGCTPQSPCYALFSENNAVLHLYSSDRSKMIRVAEHEYDLSKGSSGLHFHYYEINGDYSLNRRFIFDMKDSDNVIIDMTDPSNPIKRKTPQQIKDLLLPIKEIESSALIAK